uniref:Gamma-conotoxin-like As7a n=1 Tax=Conus cancellatus TaxID=289020 RepID=O17A_CONCF|nr:RecName: Full=Gamma-conotoxin-like As7a [Conus cancellatus]
TCKQKGEGCSLDVECCSSSCKPGGPLFDFDC